MSKTRARVTRWQLARALVENQGDKDDDGGGRKGPTGELRVISTDIQTRPRGPGRGEPSWGDLMYSSGLGSASMSWMGGFQPPFSPFYHPTPPPQTLGSGTLYQNKNLC